MKEVREEKTVYKMSFLRRTIAKKNEFQKTHFSRNDLLLVCILSFDGFLKKTPK